MGFKDSTASLLKGFFFFFFLLGFFLKTLLTVACGGSDIEMSKPLTQITRAEDAFSGCLTARRSLLCRQSFGSGCQNLSALKLHLNCEHFFLADNCIIYHNLVHNKLSVWVSVNEYDGTP